MASWTVMEDSCWPSATLRRRASSLWETQSVVRWRLTGRRPSEVFEGEEERFLRPETAGTAERAAMISSDLSVFFVLGLGRALPTVSRAKRSAESFSATTPLWYGLATGAGL